MRKFNVEVCRISYAVISLEIEAESEEQAVGLAIDQAGNHYFSEHHADYSASVVKEVSHA
jgi:hypothetical protein